MALTDANESVVERYEYDAYGACTVLDADGSADSDAISDVGNPYTFTGRRLDDESGLMQYRYRWYSPTLGRFLSRDPQEYADAVSLYVYAVASPTRALDPLGLTSGEGESGEPPFVKIIGPFVSEERFRQIEGSIRASCPAPYADAEVEKLRSRLRREFAIIVDTHVGVTRVEQDADLVDCWKQHVKRIAKCGASPFSGALAWVGLGVGTAGGVFMVSAGLHGNIPLAIVGGAAMFFGAAVEAYAFRDFNKCVEEALEEWNECAGRAR